MAEQNTSGFFGPNVFQQFLEEEPRAAYFALDKPFGSTSTPRQKGFFQNQFQNIQDEYLGALGRQIKDDRLPTLRFSDFLKDFPFSKRYAATPPQYRGDFPRQFSPPTRFLFNF
jgi:hypothetical protein